MFVVIVDFAIKSERLEEFLPLMSENAATSLQFEPDCHQFDICQDPNQPERVFLYELYTDAAAFQAHLAALHFKAFDAAVAEMVVAKSVRTLHRL